ncbi:MAG TPA: hypothetical protein VH877_28475 [Polyangia bacterium]|jgi:hypothetical protein|nr:hypothetical protein [Polyangia bacterium]
MALGTFAGDVSGLESPSSGVSIWRNMWAVVAGALVALAIQAVLMVFGGAIGLSVFEPDRDVIQGIGIGYVVWLLIALCASAFLGAWTASLVARSLTRADGLMHGFVTWAAVSLIGLFLVGGTLTNAVAGPFSMMGHMASPAVTRSLPRNADQLERQVNQQLGNARGAVNDPRVQQRADQAAAGAAVGMWGLFAALILPLGAALLGGFLGARQESLGLQRRRGFVPRGPETTTTTTPPLPTPA